MRRTGTGVALSAVTGNLGTPANYDLAACTTISLLFAFFPLFFSMVALSSVGAVCSTKRRTCVVLREQNAQ